MIQPRTKALEKVALALGTTMPQLMSGDTSGIANTLHELNDPRLTELFGQVHKLNVQEREVLKTFIEAIVTRAQLEEMVARRSA